MKMHKKIPIVVLLCCATGVMAAASDQQCQTKQSAQFQPPSTTSACTGSKIIGDKVIGRDNQDLGTIRNFVVDLQSGKISFAVLDCNGRIIPIPASMLTPVQGHEFVAQCGNQQIQSAPDFAKMDLQDPAWAARVDAYYNLPANGGNEVAANEIINEPAGAELPPVMVTAADQDAQWNQVLQQYQRGKQSARITDQWLRQQQNPDDLYAQYPAGVGPAQPATAQPAFSEPAGAEAPAGQTLIRATDLTGMTVRDNHGQQVGVIKDVVVDWTTGRVAYAVLDPEGASGLGSKYYAIPPQALTRTAAGGTLTLNIGRDRLEGAPSFDPSQWPAPSDQSFCTQVYQYYNTPMYWK